MNPRLFLSALLVIVLAGQARAQVPQFVGYQGVLTDNSGNLVADGNYALTVRLYTESSGGTLVFTESHPITPVVKGGFSLAIGTQTALSALFDVPYWLEIQVADDPPLSPRIRLASSPTALMAKTVVNNGITGAKILDGTIAAADVGANAIGTSEIATGGVASAEVLDNSLVAADLLDEPGVASATATAVINLDGTTQTLLSHAITVPASGYVYVSGGGQFSLNHSNGTQSLFELGVSNVAGATPLSQSIDVQIPSSAPSGQYQQAGFSAGVFSVGAGTHTFYLIGDEDSGNIAVNERSLTLMYFPTAYGTVATPAPQAARTIGERAAAPAPETEIDRLRRELEALRAEVEAMRSERATR